MPADMTRAHRGMNIIESYFDAREHAPIEHRDDYRGAAIDVMVDVLHALHQWGWNAEDAHAMALRHFNFETYGRRAVAPTTPRTREENTQ